MANQNVISQTETSISLNNGEDVLIAPKTGIPEIAKPASNPEGTTHKTAADIEKVTSGNVAATITAAEVHDTFLKVFPNIPSTIPSIFTTNGIEGQPVLICANLVNTLNMYRGQSQ